MECRFTVDVELDWGGRVSGYRGVDLGLPRIVEAFRAYNVKGIFFVSTELVSERRNLVKDLLAEGHEVGSHGHFHVKYDDFLRAKRDMEISRAILSTYPGANLSLYRAPWFSHKDDGIYSKEENHLSILKYTWFGGTIPENPIFYIHPFDIMGGKDAPNLKCRILYSRPGDVYANFILLLRRYGSNSTHKLVEKKTK